MFTFTFYGYFVSFPKFEVAVFCVRLGQMTAHGDLNRMHTVRLNVHLDNQQVANVYCVSQSVMAVLHLQ